MQQKRKCYNVEAARDDSVSVHSADFEVCHLNVVYIFSS